MRQTFAKTIYQQMKMNNSIYLLTADLGFMLFENIQQKFPKRFINVGVAESNMIELAAGIALTKKIVFTYSIANFATYRTFENIRNDICVHNLPVIIIGSGAGLCYSDAGPSHHSLEDISILKSIPNLDIYTPSDPVETTWAVTNAIKKLSPAYIRLGKNDPVINKRSNKLKYGKANILSKGNDFLLISMGNISFECLQAIESLKKKNIFGTLITYPMIKPFDETTLIKHATKYNKIFSVEEHSTIGGLGSSISDVISQKKLNVKLYKLGIPDKFVLKAGDHNYLRNNYGISSEKITKYIIQKYEQN